MFPQQVSQSPIKDIAFRNQNLELVVLAGRKVLTLDALTLAVKESFSVEYKQCSAFSPNGLHLVTAVPNKGAFLYDVTRAELVKVLEPDADVLAAAWTQDSQMFALSCFDGRILVYRLSPEVTRVKQFAYPALTFSLAWSPDARKLISGHHFRTVNFWDIATGEVEKSFTTTVALPSPMRLSPNGKYIALGDWIGGLELWDVQSTDLIEMYQRKIGVSAIDWSSCSRFVVWAPSDPDLSMFTLVEAADVCSDAAFGRGTIRNYFGLSPSALKWQPNGSVVAVGTYKGEIALMWLLDPEEDGDFEP